MIWTARHTRSAERSIRRLDPEVQRRVRIAVERLLENPLHGKALRLTLQDLRSWRTGHWRIVYRLIEDRVETQDVGVGHRREVYDRLRERLR